MGWWGVLVVIGLEIWDLMLDNLNDLNGWFLCFNKN